MEENDDQLFQIELDAMQKSTEQFKELVLNLVNHYYYDESIYKENLEEFAPQKINAYVKRKVRFLGKRRA